MPFRAARLPSRNTAQIHILTYSVCAFPSTIQPTLGFIILLKEFIKLAVGIPF